VTTRPAEAAGTHDTSAGLESAVDYLCRELLAGGEPDSVRIAPLLAYVRSHPDGTTGLPRYQDAPGAYRGFPVRTPMRRLLRYLYNPSIPQEVVKPFSIRSSVWTTPGAAEDQRRLWAEPWPPESQFVIRGEQYDRTTPDLSTGGSYGMTLRRAIVYVPAEMAVLSVSVQSGPSEVGTKGYMLGGDGEGLYVYSGEKGLTRTGLGWVSSRIQTNVSIGVYLQGEGPVVCGVFQWMRAGWSGLSVVQESHVAASLDRYEKLLTRNLAGLPEPERLEAMHAEASRLTEEGLRGHARDVFACRLDQLAGNAPREAVMMLRNGYEARLDQGELVALRMAVDIGLVRCHSDSSGVQASRLDASRSFQPFSTSR
jgi:hypothetical protein